MPDTKTHSLDAVQVHLLATEQSETYEELRSSTRSCWQPTDGYQSLKVDLLAGYYWDICRLNHARHGRLVDAMEAVRRISPQLTDPLKLQNETIFHTALSGGLIERPGRPHSPRQHGNFPARARSAAAAKSPRNEPGP